MGRYFVVDAFFFGRKLHAVDSPMTQASLRIHEDLYHRLFHASLYPSLFYNELEEIQTGERDCCMHSATGFKVRHKQEQHRQRTPAPRPSNPLSFSLTHSLHTVSSCWR